MFRRKEKPWLRPSLKSLNAKKYTGGADSHLNPGSDFSDKTNPCKQSESLKDMRDIDEATEDYYQSRGEARLDQSPVVPNNSDSVW